MNCKKTNALQIQKILINGMMGEMKLRGRCPGERIELFDKMGLIVVASKVRQLREASGVVMGKMADGLLKAGNANEKLRTEADFLEEQFLNVTVGYSTLAREFVEVGIGPLFKDVLNSMVRYLIFYVSR